MTTKRVGGTSISPSQETHLHLHAAVANSRKVRAAREGLIHLEPLPLEPCGRTWDGNDCCTLVEGHKGPCNVSRGDEL